VSSRDSVILLHLVRRGEHLKKNKDIEKEYDFSKGKRGPELLLRIL
jgi:hypothetical protein